MAKSPDATSTDYDAMLPYWDKVETILNGADAMKAAGDVYLPQFPNEEDVDYTYRRENAKFSNIYADIVSNLSSKPFSEKVGLEDDGSTDKLRALTEDIDGRGNNLHVFSATTFFDGVNNAVDWILVDFTKARPRPDGAPLTLEDERNQGLRPYWVHIPAKRMLAVYSDMIDGKEAIVHARMQENITRRVGFEETCIERVRVLNREPVYDVVDPENVVGYEPATFEVWEKRSGGRRGKQWVLAETGPITIGVIPLVPFVTGKRIGGSWRFTPALQGCADLQIEHFQQETALKSIKELTAFPMLAGNGVQPDIENGKPKLVPVGPRTVLYAPPFGENSQHGEWTFIEPSAESLKFLSDDVDKTEKQLRELGRQPLTATAGITVVTAALASQKASSAVQAWAWGLKDALEQAFKFTCLWLNDTTSKPTVRVFTDFSLEAGDEKGPTVLTEMRKNGDISRETEWEEMQRRGILSGDFDAEREKQRLEEELPDPDDEEDLGAASTPGLRAA